MGAAALVVSGGVLLSRILGQVREVIFAAMLGADGVTDQYVAAFRIPDFLNYLLAGGFLSITFIPIFSRYLAEDREDEGWGAFSAIIRPVLIGISMLVIIGVVFAPWVIEAIYPDFTAEQIATTTRLTRIVLPAQVFFVVGALFAAVQYSKGMFLIPSLAPVVYNLGIIAGGVAYAASTGDADPEGFIWGALAGAFLGNFALQWWGARRAGMVLFVSAPWRHPAIKEYLTIAIPLMIGQSIVVLDETFMSTFGDLVGDGAQTHLLYARRTMFVPVGVIAQAAAVAAYPFLARLWAEGKLHAMAATVDKALRYVLVLSLAAAALLAALSVPVIETIFERGSFEAGDTIASASALFFYAFSIPIWGALQILTRGFYARREMWTPVVVGTAVTAVALPLYWLMQRSFGIEGVAVASVLALGFYTIALGAIWYREHSGRLRAVIEPAARSIPLVVAGALAAAGAASLVDQGLPDGFMGSLIATLAGTVAFAAVVFGLGSGLHDVLNRPKDRATASRE